jgi:outer membrane protein TolC
MTVSSAPRRGAASRPCAALVLLALSCTPSPPALGGAPATSRAPNAPWVPPANRPEYAATPPAPDSMAALPADLSPRLQTLTLADVVDLALRNNPTTRQTWANARAAADLYGATRGPYYPEIDGELSATWLRTTATQGRSATQQTVYGPVLNLSWLLLDFGRSGVSRGAREALIAADWTHNATIQNVVLNAQAAFFQYMATRALLGAQRSTVEEARAALEAAEQRNKVGLATIADVLQARTALSQAELDALTTEGALATTRGALAVSMGLPANLPYDVDSLAGQQPVALLADSVDALIARAVLERPDLAAIQAQVRQSEARVTEARGARLPSLVLTGSNGFTGVGGTTSLHNNYAVTLGLQIPIFNGFAREYTQRAAEAQADASRAAAQSLRQQVIFEVFSSYYTLQTATRRVQTTDDLLESAQRSAEVALGRYREGVGSVIDLLTAEAALAQARAQQVQARWAWQAALAQLAHDTGMLDERGGSGIRLSPDSTSMEPSQ